MLLAKGRPTLDNKGSILCAKMGRFMQGVNQGVSQRQMDWTPRHLMHIGIGESILLLAIYER